MQLNLPLFSGFNPTSIHFKLNYSKAVMSKTYVIQWKSAVNGRSGKGTKLFDFEQARRLADELNQEFPGIHHEPVEANPPLSQAPVGPAPQTLEEPSPAELGESGAEAPQITHDSDPVLSVR